MGTVKRAAGGGEIVQVQGGHIIRSTGRKDRHSKVYTAKGPRDRRVRLAAHTAIQFYDVQDRLGYDRPSKAVDWLISKAKYAIDKLAQLPPFDPDSLDSNALQPNGDLGAADLAAAGGAEQSESPGYEIQPHGHHPAPSAGLDSQSFFPASTADNSMGFQGYPHQDLCLSLQSFQNAGFIHGGESETGNPNNSHNSVFPAGFGGGGGWLSETNPEEMGRFSRLLAWHGGGGAGEGYDVGGGVRGTLQSSFHSPASIRAWSDLPMEQEGGTRHPSMAGIGIHSSDGFAGFCAPPQIHRGGGQEVPGTAPHHHHHHRTSSMSTDSSH